MGEKQGKKIKVYIAAIAAVLFVFLIVGGIAYCFTHNKSYKNDAFELVDGFCLNGVRYDVTSELKEYTISNVLICKADQGMKIYEIEGYPDYEYVAGYHMWDGQIYKKDESDRLK
ncbi:MAG: hypothetical protein K2N90_08025 [Lachnospiraceae bacterium]|nr:hypothetical protein [Lachnospiraceae bacterium]